MFYIGSTWNIDISIAVWKIHANDESVNSHRPYIENLDTLAE